MDITPTKELALEESNLLSVSPTFLLVSVYLCADKVGDWQ